MELSAHLNDVGAAEVFFVGDDIAPHDAGIRVEMPGTNKSLPAEALLVQFTCNRRLRIGNRR